MKSAGDWMVSFCRTPLVSRAELEDLVSFARNVDSSGRAADALFVAQFMCRMHTMRQSNHPTPHLFLHSSSDPAATCVSQFSVFAS